jgi:glycine/D-amino acid oxidase-like deaminating enzyme
MIKDVVVVGGGIVGVCVTYRLALAGAKVVLLERGYPAGGTSGASFAWINANDKPPYEYHVLNLGGISEHLRLAKEFGTAPWLHLSGNMEWAVDPAVQVKVRAKIERLRSFGYQVEILSRSEALRLEPELNIPPEVNEVVFYPAEGYVDVPLLVGTLVKAARATGAEIRVGAEVTRVERSNGQVTGVTLSDGTGIAADVVVSCLGWWTHRLVELAGVLVPMKPTVGLLVVSTPSGVSLRTVVHTPAVSLRPDGAGRVMMHSAEADQAVNEHTPTVPPPPVCTRVLQDAAQVLPGLAGAGIETARIGVRPIPADGYPIVGPVPGLEGLYVVCSHSAVTMGPLFGRIVAAEILEGRVDPRIGPYRPERLVSLVE